MGRPPILVPAIHQPPRDSRHLPARDWGINPDITDEPATGRASRNRLRNKFLNTTVAVSGTNFGIAETGTLTIVESGVAAVVWPHPAPDTLITFIGIEKILPTFQDYEAFLQLLPVPHPPVSA